MSDYLQQWKRFDRLRREMNIATWGGLLLFPIARLALWVSGTSPQPDLLNFYLPFSVWITAQVFCKARISSLPCPQCGKPFSPWWDKWRWTVLPDQCSNCGLPMYADPPAEQSPADYWRSRAHSNTHSNTTQ